MTRDQTRDRALEALLRKAPAGEPKGECLDADTLAAWFEGRLGGESRTAAEAHASACGRCQALAAALVRTLPPEEPRVARHRAMMLLRWGTPLAAAAALILWVAGGRGPSESGVPAPVQIDRTAAVRADRNLPAPAPPGIAAPQEPERPAAKAQTGRARAPEPRNELAGAPPPALPAPTTPAPAAALPGAPVPLAAPPAPSAAAASPVAAPRTANAEEVRVDASARDAGRGAGRGGGGAGARATPPPPPPPPPPALALPPPAQESAKRFDSFTASVVDVVSPDPSIRWRVSGASLQRSSDGGRTWEALTLEPGTVLTAGSAPASGICWMVGRTGAVLLSTDGRTFRRLRFPQAIDLTAVRATDARSAVVTAADGRRFATANGGETWTLQESPAAPF